MKASSRLTRVCALLLSGLCLGIAEAQIPIAVQGITVIGSEQGIGVQITANGPMATQAQMLRDPDRLIIDFPGAVPGTGLRSLRLSHGEIKAVRTALWRSNPPVTRVVIDLDEPTTYRLITAGKSLNVILGADLRPIASNVVSEPIQQHLPGISKSHPTPDATADFVRPLLRVRFDRGLLTISATNATLADVLYQVHVTTGANVPIPSGAAEEKVVIQAGPGAAKDVIAALLNGSRFNYVLQGTAQDPQSVGTLLLTPKPTVAAESAYPQTPPMQLPVGAQQGQPAAPVASPNPPLEPVEQLGLHPEFTPNPEPPEEQ